VRIRAQALPGRAFVGRVDRIAPVVDPRTGTVKATVNVPWEEGLRPGMFLDVEIVTAVEERALLVPKRALVLDDDEVYVFRVTDEGTAERVAIVPALEAPGAVAVADGELAPGQRVIIAGQAGIKAGDEVRIVSEPAAEPPAEASAGESPGE
jgi:RND family efflux transporter MFP subunit